ncbi:EFR1 family ferrodoxin [Clostridium sp.]|uniref:EFR1 family ferrodoxin n=1 Tax=Clostridium sp. TaxID=1506 RepID=UPI0029144F95|nr:EFR1 family ferrodoxin [Clostridium sp.]MDU5105547.1 EFR1 family ferrodoxin [Clostridium sp.]
MRIYYFTSTGNSLYVAKKIKESVENCELISIPKALKEEDFNVEDNVIGFVYPIHCGSLPIVVEDFISKLHIKGKSYIFAVGVTGGGKAKISFPHINEVLGDKGSLSNYLCVKYISNYTRAGKNPTKERALKAIKLNEGIIDNFINSIKNQEVKTVDYKASKKLIYNGWKNLFKNKDKGFNVNDKCIGCEMCKIICPVDNIKMINNKPTWLGNCTDCMACINICPKEAINIGNSTLKKNRYRNPFIEVKELVSND